MSSAEASDAAHLQRHVELQTLYTKMMQMPEKSDAKLACPLLCRAIFRDLWWNYCEHALAHPDIKKDIAVKKEILVIRPDQWHGRSTSLAHLVALWLIEGPAGFSVQTLHTTLREQESFRQKVCHVLQHAQKTNARFHFYKITTHFLGVCTPNKHGSYRTLSMHALSGRGKPDLHADVTLGIKIPTTSQVLFQFATYMDRYPLVIFADAAYEGPLLSDRIDPANVNALQEKQGHPPIFRIVSEYRAQSPVPLQSLALQRPLTPVLEQHEED